MKKQERSLSDSSNGADLDIETNKTWDKFVRQSKKVGFREGANDARDNRFQEFFDIGYDVGFQNGLQEGNRSGILKAQELLQNADAIVDAPINTSCLLCENEELKTLPLAEVTEMIADKK